MRSIKHFLLNYVWEPCIKFGRQGSFPTLRTLPFTSTFVITISQNLVKNQFTLLCEQEELIVGC
jgi:hypothetical protein